MKTFSFWLKTTAVLQILTALIHSISFFVPPQAVNDTERQLIDLMNTYQSDMGNGFHRSMADLFLSMSICFTLLYLFGGVLNFYLLRKKAGAGLWKGLLHLQLAVFGSAFLVFMALTFLPPIVLTGLVFASLFAARLYVDRA